MTTRIMNTRAAQEAKLSFLLAAAQGDGDLTSLLAWADWLEEHGGQKRAARVRKDALRWAAEEDRTVTGETWLRWHAAYQLGLIADALAKSETAFRRFMYRHNYNANGSLAYDDGSMQYQLARGWVPTLSRRSKRQMKLARIIEGLGYRVFLIG
jgi:uncharacterized protein (TIGR02996 family)